MRLNCKFLEIHGLLLDAGMLKLEDHFCWLGIGSLSRAEMKLKRNEEKHFEHFCIETAADKEIKEEAYREA